jgi:hypothetical protein
MAGMARTTINRLSDRRVRTAKPGMHPDGGGLYLRVTEGKEDKDGTPVLNRYWLFRYAHRSTGKDRQLGLGPLDTVTLAAARAAGEQLLAGLDPVEQRRAQRASNALADAKAMTFDQCRDAYITAHRAGWRNAKHPKQRTATLTTYVTPVFGHLPVGATDTGLCSRSWSRYGRQSRKPHHECVAGLKPFLIGPRCADIGLPRTRRGGAATSTSCCQPSPKCGKSSTIPRCPTGR